MKVRIKVKDDTYFIKLLSIFSKIPPFNKLRPKELTFYALLLTMNYKYRNIPFIERNRLIFSYESKTELAAKMNTKLWNVYNLITSLKASGIIDKDSLIPKHTFNKVGEVTFIFEDDTN